MARTHARILASIWDDPDFIALSPEAQRLYMLLLSQDTLSNSGRILLTVKRWSGGCRTTSVADIEKALAELDDAHFVAVDHDTEEVLIRSFIRNDGVVKQPQMMKSALREALVIRSARLRSMLARELRRLHREDAAMTAEQIDPVEPPDPTPPADNEPDSPIQAPRKLEADSEQTPGSLGAGSAQPAELRRGRGRGSTSSPVRSTQVEGGAAKRGTRIPDDFAVTQPMVVWARRECPDVDGRFETSQFIDYWAAKAGKDAVKLDWTRTWQTWMRRAQRDAVTRPGRHLRPVPDQTLPPDPALAFDDLRTRGDAAAAARLIETAWIEPSQPPSDRTPPREWLHARRVEWIDAHATALRAALAERQTG